MRASKILGIAILMLLTFTPCIHAQETIVLSNGDWPPYFSEDFKHGGVGTLICSKAFALEGIKVDYKFLPWKRGLEMAHQGKTDGALGWRKTEERAAYFHFSDPILDQNLVFFHRLGKSFDWETLDDVGHMRIGATLGYTYVPLLEKITAKNGGQIEVAPSDETNLAKLLAGRIDIFPCAEAVAYYLLRSRFTPGAADMVRHHPRRVVPGKIHLLISKKTENGEELIWRFNQGLKKLHESGEYERLMDESLRGKFLPDR